MEGIIDFRQHMASFLVQQGIITPACIDWEMVRQNYRAHVLSQIELGELLGFESLMRDDQKLALNVCTGDEYLTEARKRGLIALLNALAELSTVVTEKLRFWPFQLINILLSHQLITQEQIQSAEVQTALDAALKNVRAIASPSHSVFRKDEAAENLAKNLAAA